MKHTSYYGFDAVRVSLIHFLTGKAFSAISAILIFILIARALPKEDYAVLVVFQATVMFAGVLASFGITQSIIRYIPELRSDNNNVAMYSMLFRGIFSRAIVFSATLFAIVLAADQYASFFDYDDEVLLLPLYLVAGFFRLMMNFIASAMESLMWQKSSQYILALSFFLKLLLISGFYFVIEKLTFISFIYIEIFTTFIGAVLLFASLVRNWRKDKHRYNGNLLWLTRHKKRIFKYGLSGYMRALTSVLYGSAPNRLVAGRFLARESMGEYGFAESVSSLLHRFLPAHLMQGIIRPIFISKYSKNNDMAELNNMGNFVFRASIIILAPAVVLMTVTGQQLLDWLTVGKYGVAAYLVAGIIVVLMFESLRSQQELVCVTLEKNGVLVKSNLVLSVSIAFCIPLFPFLGAWSIITANIIGNIMAIILIYRSLLSMGYRLSLDLRLVNRIFLAMFVSISFGRILITVSDAVIVISLLSLMVYCVILWIWKPFSTNEIELLRRLLKKKGIESNV
jgi:O-antigen/teichoic acid export membrane protein